MKTLLLAGFVLLHSSLSWADDCSRTVDNMIRWSELTVKDDAREEQIEQCRTAVEAGEAEAITSSRCLSKRRLSRAVACLRDAIQAHALAACEAQPDPQKCREDATMNAEALGQELRQMLVSGQPLQSEPPPPPLQLPPPPSDAGSCQEMFVNVQQWSGQSPPQDKLSRLLQVCETELAEQRQETQTVVLCLSQPVLDDAMSCMLVETVREMLGECASADAAEQAMCEQMLVGLIEPKMEELRESILKGTALQ